MLDVLVYVPVNSKGFCGHHRPVRSLAWGGLIENHSIFFMLSDKLLGVVDHIFVNRLTEIEDVLAVLLVEVREIALVPLALSGGFFQVFLLLIEQFEERGSVYRSLGLLVERD